MTSGEARGYTFPMVSPIKPIPIRLPDPLKEAVDHIARLDGRSRHSTLVDAVRAYVESRENTGDTPAPAPAVAHAKAVLAEAEAQAAHLANPPKKARSRWAV